MAPTKTSKTFFAVKNFKNRKFAKLNEKRKLRWLRPYVIRCGNGAVVIDVVAHMWKLNLNQTNVPDSERIRTETRGCVGEATITNLDSHVIG